MIENLSLKSKTGHIMTVDIKFDEAQPNTKTLVYNEIYSPLFEKKKQAISTGELLFPVCRNINHR